MTAHALRQNIDQWPSRQEQVYHAAHKAMDDAIGPRNVKPFDALRAGTLLSTWLLCRGDYVSVSLAAVYLANHDMLTFTRQAWMMIGTAAR